MGPHDYPIVTINATATPKYADTSRLASHSLARMTRTLLTFVLLSCAAVAHADPVRFHPDDLGQDGRITLSPGFSPDGRTLYFAQSEGSPIWRYPQRLKTSTRTADGWTRPRLVPLPDAPRIAGRKPLEPRVDFPSVSPDGRTLLFSWSVARAEFADRDIVENFDLYSLDLTRPDAVPKRLEGADINRLREGRARTLRYVNNENEPTLTRDGDLYFWSERFDGLGERDIYVARGDGAGGFRDAEALPAPVNSPGRDNGSFVTPDGRLMLMSYADRGGEGGSDIFLSVNVDGAWTEPVPLGPEVNGPASDFAGRITPDGRDLVFTSTRAFDDTPEGLIQVWTVPVADVPALRRAMAR